MKTYKLALLASAILCHQASAASLTEQQVEWTLNSPCFAPGQQVECQGLKREMVTSLRQAITIDGSCSCQATGQLWNLSIRCLNGLGDSGLFQRGSWDILDNSGHGWSVRDSWHWNQGSIVGWYTRTCE